MSKTDTKIAALRADILADPHLILDDKDIMSALISGGDELIGNNVFDLRNMALQHMSTRLDELSETHSTVVSTAYDNLATANQINRAILALLDPQSFADFLKFLETTLAESLNIGIAKLCLETPVVRINGQPQTEYGTGVAFLLPTTIARYAAGSTTVLPRPVTLRKTAAAAPEIFGEEAGNICSEALVLIQLGADKQPGLLALGSTDPDQLAPGQATDLLLFYGAVFERVMRRWLN
jgi:uncharacterized protein YigA (DUF484 family)